MHLIIACEYTILGADVKHRVCLDGPELARGEPGSGSLRNSMPASAAPSWRPRSGASVPMSLQIMRKNTKENEVGMETPRMRREKKTIAAMVRIYCRKKHHTRAAAGLCPACGELLEYALFRLERCPFGAEKPTCARCPIHCYRKDMRERVRDVMRFAGPRMIFSHGILALRHMLDGLRRCETSHRKPAQRPKDERENGKAD